MLYPISLGINRRVLFDGGGVLHVVYLCVGVECVGGGWVFLT